MKLLPLLLLYALWLAPVSASEMPGSDLQSLLDYAREHNPELAAARHKAVAAQERTEAAGTLPDPVLRAELMDVTHQGTTAPHLLPAQTGSTRYLLMQRIPWYGRRDLQRAAAESLAMQARSEAFARWNELAGRIRAAHARHYFALASEQLLQQSLVLLDELDQTVTTRYANGLGSQQDVIRVQIEKTRLKSELIALQKTHHHIHTELNALLSRPVSAPLAEPLRLPPEPAPSTLTETALQERLLKHNPALQAAEAAIQAAKRERELAHASGYPDFTIGIAPTQRGGVVKSWDVMFELNIPLQQSSRHAQEQAAEEMLRALTAHQQALLEQMQAELSKSLAELEAARQTEILIASRLLPQAELAMHSAQTGYEHGQVDSAMLIEAQRQVLKARQQRLQIETDRQLHLANIEKLLGEIP